MASSKLCDRPTVDFHIISNLTFDLLTTCEGEQRKVIYRYDVHNHVSEILYDGHKTEFTYDVESGELTSVDTRDCLLIYHRNGHLVEKHSISMGRFSVTFNYFYDAHLRLVDIKVGTRYSDYLLVILKLKLLSLLKQPISYDIR